MSLKDDLFNELNREAQTIAQLTTRFGVTRNSVVVHLKELESSGLVTRVALNREGRVGKPATLYAATAGNEDRNSLAYRSFSEMLVRALGKQFSSQQRQKFYERMGRAEGKAIDFSDHKSLKDRLAATQSFADEMGAATSLEHCDSKYILRSFTCPIAALVRIEPCACVALAALFEQLTGRPTREACLRGEKLVCQFEIEK